MMPPDDTRAYGAVLLRQFVLHLTYMPLGFKGYQKGHKGFRKYPPKVECTCITCGLKFMRRPCEVSRFCSHPCYAKSRIGVGTNRVTTSCERCGKSVTRIASQKAKYCSKECCDDDKRTDTATRFWPRVQKSEGCWLWIGNIGTDGYGKFWLRGRTTHAHRVAYELTRGPIQIDDPRFVCHRCDNPPCCNPEHLFLGTHRENTDDMIQKGRSTAGERSGNAKLTNDEVRAMRNQHVQGVPIPELAKRFGISATNAHSVVRRRTWRHIE